MATDRSPGQRAMDALAADFEALRRDYARYFAGVDRVPPSQAHKAFRRKVQATLSQLGNNTGLLFRFNALKAACLTHETLWGRTLAQIEAGTWAPHRRQAAARQQDVAAAPATPPGTPAREVAAGPMGGLGGVLQRLHDAYLAAAAETQTPPPSLAALSQEVADKVRAVRAQSGVRQVDVKVVVENNQPQLRVLPRGE